MFDCDFEDALLILISLRTKHELPFKIFVSKFEGWKGRHSYGRPRAALSLATPLAAHEMNRTLGKQVIRSVSVRAAYVY